MKWPGTLAIPDFRRLWMGQTVSQLGDALYGLVFVFMANRVSGGNAAVVGLVAAANALPFLLFAPLAGVAADRYDRRRLMLLADLASAALLGAFAAYLVLVQTPAVTLIAATGFLLSAVNAFFLPARAAAVPRLVPPELLAPALGLSNATMSLMHTVGVGLAAVLLGPLERSNPESFFLAAVVVNLTTFLVSALFIARLPAVVPERAEESQGATKELAEGLQAVLREPLLRVVLPASIVMNLAVSGFFVVYVRTNDEWFGGAFSTISWIEFSFLGSMVVGSLLSGHLRVVRPGIAFSLGMAGVGACVAAMGHAPWLPGYVALNVLCGLVLPTATLPLATYIGTVVPDHLRGRVSSVWTMTSAGVQPLGMAASGGLLELLGLVRLYWAMGGGMVLAAVSALASRGYRSAQLPQASKVRSEE